MFEEPIFMSHLTADFNTKKIVESKISLYKKVRFFSLLCSCKFIAICDLCLLAFL